MEWLLLATYVLNSRSAHIHVQTHARHRDKSEIGKDEGENSGSRSTGRSHNIAHLSRRSRGGLRVKKVPDWVDIKARRQPPSATTPLE